MSAKNKMSEFQKEFDALLEKYQPKAAVVTVCFLKEDQPDQVREACRTWGEVADCIALVLFSMLNDKVFKVIITKAVKLLVGGKLPAFIMNTKRKVAES